MGERCPCSVLLRSVFLQTFSNPLDWLSGSSFASRLNLVITKFKDFLNIEDLEYETCGSKWDIYSNKKSGVVYFHDFPAGEDMDTAFIKVKEKYDRRIARFLDKMSNSKKVLAVYIESFQTTSDMHSNDELIDAVQKMHKSYNTKSIDLLYMAQDDSFENKPAKVEKINGSITKISLFNRDYEADAWEIDYEKSKEFFRNIRLVK